MAYCGVFVKRHKLVHKYKTVKVHCPLKVTLQSRCAIIVKRLCVLLPLLRSIRSQRTE